MPHHSSPVAVRRHRARVCLSSFLPAACGLLLAGCGGEEWHATTVPVSGTVLINGLPAANAIVELHAVGEPPDSRNSRPWGIVQLDGTYELTTYQQGDGAPPGDYALTLRWPSDLSSPGHFDRLAGMFDSVDTAPLTVTIEDGENSLPAVELSDVKVLPVEKSTKPQRRMPGPGPGPGPRGAR